MNFVYIAWTNVLASLGLMEAYYYLHVSSPQSDILNLGSFHQSLGVLQ